MEDEDYNGERLAWVTHGFSHLGYFGNEEIFEYAGRSLACLDTLLKLVFDGYVEVASKTDAELRSTPLFKRLKRYYPADDDQMIIDRIRSQFFIRDPAHDEEVSNTRRVQIAQDALIVETIPGNVPLLEAFQMAHRMLDVQKACLENQHLSERIKGRPWERDGEDSYRVLRREGEGGSVSVQIGSEQTSSGTI
jgi:hypothetical protein